MSVSTYDIYGEDYTVEEVSAVVYKGAWVMYDDYQELESKYERVVDMIADLYREV